MNISFGYTGDEESVFTYEGRYMEFYDTLTVRFDEPEQIEHVEFGLFEYVRLLHGKQRNILFVDQRTIGDRVYAFFEIVRD